MKKKQAPVGPAALTLFWVPVTTADGRTRMEMRWRSPRVVQKASAA
ncbi:MAG TPA: hypothetical protein PLZ92_11530 [Phycicoccus sp.]|nr:hypothetical protein [Phycicoccus sp.]